MTDHLLTGRTLMKTLFTCIAVLMLSSAAIAELDTVTYVTHDGGGDGDVEGDISGVGEVTLLDGAGGDMWNGGDQFIYLHEGEQRNSDFTATVRVVAQTEAIDGRWGKAGIRASANLTGLSQNAMTQVYAGNGSQADPPENGDHSPIPVRIGGRTGDDGNGGFERPILDAEGNEIANNVFPNPAGTPTNVSWLSLDYDAASNTFVSGYALDEGGAPGAWSFSEPVTDVPADGDGWYVGLAYSAHNSLALEGDALHGITFDNFSIVPEPSSIGLALFGLLGFLGFRRRNR